MKTKIDLDQKITTQENLNVKSRPKSLRPMRSMVAVRSLRPKTVVANLIVKSEDHGRVQNAD